MSKKNPITVQDMIDLLSDVSDKAKPVYAFCDGTEQTFSFQRGSNGIASDVFYDENEDAIPAVYLLVLRHQGEP
mgnify:CR=1 FL=1